MQQDDILAQDVVKLMLISQAVMTAAMNRNGTSEVLSGACLESSNNNNNNDNVNVNGNDNNHHHNAFQLMMS